MDYRQAGEMTARPEQEAPTLDEQIALLTHYGKAVVGPNMTAAILASLREYGAAVRARDAEIADGMVGGICEDESHGGSSHDACAIQCAAAISREPLP